MSVHEKSTSVCPEHSIPRDMFHQPTRMTLCSQCLVDKQISRDQCVESRKFCQAMMERFVALLDNATYMPIEHMQKEKEYGIVWRTNFKRELIQHADETHRQFLGDQAGGFQPQVEDPFVFFHRVVKKETLDAATFDAQSQADFMCMMMENLEHLELSIYVVKALLKEPSFRAFEAVKAETLQKVKESQALMNPQMKTN